MRAWFISSRTGLYYTSKQINVYHTDLLSSWFLYFEKFLFFTVSEFINLLLFQFFFETFQRYFLLSSAQQLVICVRLALKEGANGALVNNFGGYLITLLVIFYMQVTGRLPPVVNLQSEPGLSTEKCGGMFLWFISFYMSLFPENQSFFYEEYFFVVISSVCSFLPFLHKS